LYIAIGFLLFVFSIKELHSAIRRYDATKRKDINQFMILFVAPINMLGFGVMFFIIGLIQ